MKNTEERHSSAWLLAGARVAQGPRTAIRADIEIRGGRLAELRQTGDHAHRADTIPTIDLGGCLVLPGLINAHDHLAFNLFPRLGKGPYGSAMAWAEDVYRPQESPIKEYLEVPKAERLVWGGIKNLLSGVTTVCHHDPYEESVFDERFPVRVMKRFGWAHSVAFTTDVAERFKQTPADWPFILHLMEGTGGAVREEISRLHSLGALDERTVLVHPVALDAESLALVERSGASLIWCPSASLFTLGKALPPRLLERPVPMALGTDSAITTQGSLLDELAVASRLTGWSNNVLYKLVTGQAARVLRLRDGEGGLRQGGRADLVAVADGGGSPADALRSMAGSSDGLGMVMTAGEIKLLSPSFAERAPEDFTGSLSPITVEERGTFLIDVDLPGLFAATQGALRRSDPIRLAGRSVFCETKSAASKALR